MIGIDIKPFFSFELLFALIYIDSKRNPEGRSLLWFITVESKYNFEKDKYLPFALLLLSIMTGGDIVSDIIGIAAGHIYYTLNDVFPIKYRKNYLFIPKLM